MTEHLIKTLEEKFPYRNWRMWLEWYKNNDERLTIASRIAIEREMEKQQHA